MATLCTALATIAFACMPVEEPPDPIEGWLSQYDRAPTIGTLDYRFRVGDLPVDGGPVVGYIATKDCHHVGKRMWISVDGDYWMPVAVFDCSGHKTTTEWMRDNQIVAEVDYFTAVALGIENRGGVPVRLSLDKPTVLYQVWFEQRGLPIPV